MNAIEFKELVKIAAEKMKDSTVHQMLQSDLTYNEDTEREGSAEQRYLQLDLTEEQKIVCDALLECRDKQDFEYSIASYMAGIHDAFRIMMVLFPEKWGQEEIKEVLFPKEE